MSNRVAQLLPPGSAGYGAQVQGQVLAALPLASLFGAPFEAAANAQNELAQATAKFIRQFGMDNSGNVWMNTFTSYYDIPTSEVPDISGGYLLDASGGGIFCAEGGDTNGYKEVTSTSGVKTKYKVSAFLTASDKPPPKDGITSPGYTKRIAQRVYILDDGGKVLYVQGIRSISVPFISLVNIPALFIDVVQVEFAITIKSQSVVQTNSSNTYGYENTNSGSQKGWGWNWGSSYNYKSDYTSHTKATSTSTASAESDTSTESTYMVAMKAKQVDPPGLTAIMNFITGNKDTSTKKMLGSNGKIINDRDSTKLV
jgi:hypothetical protein